MSRERHSCIAVTDKGKQCTQSIWRSRLCKKHYRARLVATIHRPGVRPSKGGAS